MDFTSSCPQKRCSRWGRLKGLEIALSDYLRNWKISKERVNDARASISREIDEVFEKVKAANGEVLLRAISRKQCMMKR